MKVLDLFCGLGGWSKAFLNAGHSCTGVDLEDKGYAGRFIQADLNDWEPEEKYDVVLASPPCTEFSIAKKWGWGTQDERIGLDLVWRTFYLIEKISPAFYVVENVKGLADFLPAPNEIIKYNRHSNGKAAYLWSNIGKLGFFDRAINHPKDDYLKSKYSYKIASAMLSEIPYALSLGVLDKIKEKRKEAKEKRKV